jgi:hypothetical protein
MIVRTNRPVPDSVEPSRELADAAEAALRAVDAITAATFAGATRDEVEEAGRYLRDLTTRARRAEDDSLTALMISVQDGPGEADAAVDAVRAMAGSALDARG